MIVALEGHSYSGKTFLLNKLNNIPDVSIIGEADKYAGGIENYPPFPAINYNMAIDSAIFFADIEIERTKDINKLPARKIVFTDRSFLSAIIFQKYMKYLNIPGEYNSYEYMKKQSFELLRQKKIFLPDYLVFVKCKSLDIYFLRQNRVISVELLKSKKAKEYFETYYNKIFKVYQNYNRSLKVETDNDVNNVNDNLNLINQQTSRIQPLSDSEFSDLSFLLEGAL